MPFPFEIVVLVRHLPGSVWILDDFTNINVVLMELALENPFTILYMASMSNLNGCRCVFPRSLGKPHQTISDQYPFILLRLRLGLQACLPAERLFQGETDGSSFPNGGLRVTHSAAAFTTWDRTSAPFVLNKTLYIPCAFVTHFGNLDLPSSVLLFWSGNLQ